MQKDLFIKFHKDLFCMIDKWYGLTIADIRMLEDEIKKELDETTGKLGHIISEDEEKPSSTKSTPF